MGWKITVLMVTFRDCFTSIFLAKCTFLITWRLFIFYFFLTALFWSLFGFVLRIYFKLESFKVFQSYHVTWKRTMNMSEFILIDVLEHFSLAFTNETLLFGWFSFRMFTEIAFPGFVRFMKAGIVAIFMDNIFTEGACMDFECFFPFLLLFFFMNFFLLSRILSETNLTKSGKFLLTLQDILFGFFHEL